MTILKFIIYILFAISAFFTLAGVVGFIRMPDIYSRIGTGTNIAVLGTLPLFIGVSLYSFFVLRSPSIGVRSLIIGFLVLLIYPVASRRVLASSIEKSNNVTSRRMKYNDRI